MELQKGVEVGVRVVEEEEEEAGVADIWVRVKR